jgi:hypothetical protein
LQIVYKRSKIFKLRFTVKNRKKLDPKTLQEIQMQTQKLSAIILILTLALLIASGCGGSRKGDYESPKPPPWVLNPPQAEDTYYGIGIAEKANPSLGQQAADSRARDAIARTIEVQVNNLIRDAMEEVMTSMGPEVRDYTESASKQVASQTLRGCVIEKRDVSGKTWYALARYNVADAAKQILETARNEALKREALYQKALAEQSFDRLDQEVQKLKGETKINDKE